MYPEGGVPGRSPKQQSRWLWWVFLGCGTLCCVGFIIAAIKVQNRRFVQAAVISVIASGVCIGTVVIWPPVEEASRKTSSDTSADLGNASASGWIIMAIWAGLILYGLVLNHDYKKFLRDEDDENNLRWHSNRAQTQAFYAPRPTGGAPAPTYAPPPAPPPRVQSAPHPRVQSAPPVDPLGAEADRYLATQPPGNAPASVPPNAPVT